MCCVSYIVNVLFVVSIAFAKSVKFLGVLL